MLLAGFTFIAFKNAPVLMIVAAGLLYVASRAAADAMPARDDESPGRAAFAHWMPIAFVALIAAATGRFEISLGVIFATSIAALSLNLGVLTILSDGPGPVNVAGMRAWPFVMPAALLPFLAGFSGRLNLLHGAMFAALGITIAQVWIHPIERHRAEPPPEPTERRPLNIPKLIAAGLAGIIGAWLGCRATTLGSEQLRVVSSGLVAATVLSPLLVLPILGSGSPAAQQGHLPTITGTLVGVALLNLCALLPMVIAISYVRGFALLRNNTTDDIPWTKLAAVPLPLAVWRVDAVILIVLGLLLVPVSMGRWQIRRGEGAALIIVYAIYLAMTTSLGVRG